MSLTGSKFEDFVAELLSNLGYVILGKRVKVYVNGVEVGEVDILAQDQVGNKYAIEVKSGKIDVSGIRQAYTNAKLLNAKPMIIARGFSNDSAKVLAEQLDVKTIILDEVFILKIEELKNVFEMVLYEVINSIIDSIHNLVKSSVINEELINVINKCNDWKCVCNELNKDDVSCRELIINIKHLLNVKSTSFYKVKTLIKLMNLMKLLSRD